MSRRQLSMKSDKKHVRKTIARSYRVSRRRFFFARVFFISFIYFFEVINATTSSIPFSKMRAQRIAHLRLLNIFRFEYRSSKDVGWYTNRRRPHTAIGWSNKSEISDAVSVFFFSSSNILFDGGEKESGHSISTCTIHWIRLISFPYECYLM